MTDSPLFDPAPYDHGPDTSGPTRNQRDPAPIVPVRAGTTAVAAFLMPTSHGRTTPTKEIATWHLLTGGNPPQAHLVYVQVERGAKAVCGRIGAVLDAEGVDLPACPNCYRTT